MNHSTPRQMADPFLGKMLDEGRVWDLFYGPDLLSDHLPMSLTALRRLGASDRQLESFAERYSRRLEPPRFTDTPLPGNDAWAARGQIRHYPALCRHFDAELQRLGRDAVLHAWIPRLVTTAGVDAFHPLIRTALAVESGVDSALACGLAYWVGSWQDMDWPDAPREQITADEAFHRLRMHPPAGLGLPMTGMFGEQLAQLATRPEFTALIRLRGRDTGLAELACSAARIYLACGHFFALHMVTGTQAVHHLAPWAGDIGTVIDALWMHLAATYLIIGRPDFTAIADHDDETPPAEAVLAAALNHTDEHIAKLAYSARYELAHWGHCEHRMILRQVAQGTARLGF